METRRHFVKSAAVVGGALVADKVAVSQTVAKPRFADKLTDGAGRFYRL